MILGIYSVHDGAVMAFMPPFFERSDGSARRAFTVVANDPKHAFARHPADYTLFCIGTFDDSKGEIVACEPRPLCRALDVVAPVVEASAASH